MDTEHIINEQQQEGVLIYSTDITERFEDLAHRVLDQGYTQAVESMGLLLKKLVYEAGDEYQFYAQLCQAYAATSNSLAKSRSCLAERTTTLQYAKAQQALMAYYLKGKTEEEAFAFILDGKQIWNWLQVEAHGVSERIVQDSLIELLEKGYKSWKYSSELASTLQWRESSSSAKQVTHLYEALLQLGYIAPNTKQEHFLMLFTSERPLYKVMWTQRGLPSLLYLAETLLQKGLLSASPEIRAAAKDKQILELDRVVMPWLFSCICSGFVIRETKGKLKYITPDMLVDARYSACDKFYNNQRWPGWAAKLDKVVEQVRQLS